MKEKIYLETDDNYRIEIYTCTNPIYVLYYSEEGNILFETVLPSVAYELQEDCRLIFCTKHKNNLKINDEQIWNLFSLLNRRIKN